MEIHHHNHTARRKWQHYIWEFLMLFLAVFCGFLAEYQLEHKIEKERGIKYIRSFCEDLRADTTRFANIIRQYEDKVKALEGMSDCYDRIAINRSDNHCLISLISHSMGFTDLLPTDRTLHQLKNAGGFRLLNDRDADSIFKYDRIIGYTLSLQVPLQEAQTNLRNIAYNLFSYNLIKQLLRGPVGFTQLERNIRVEGQLFPAGSIYRSNTLITFQIIYNELIASSST